MDTIINISAVTDNSGESPITTVSNPVTTVANTPEPPDCECRDCCRCCYCRCYRCCREYCYNCRHGCCGRRMNKNCG